MHGKYSHHVSRKCNGSLAAIPGGWLPKGHWHRPGFETTCCCALVCCVVLVCPPVMCALWFVSLRSVMCRVAAAAGYTCITILWWPSGGVTFPGLLCLWPVVLVRSAFFPAHMHGLLLCPLPLQGHAEYGMWLLVDRASCNSVVYHRNTWLCHVCVVAAHHAASWFKCMSPVTSQAAYIACRWFVWRVHMWG